MEPESTRPPPMSVMTKLFVLSKMGTVGKPEGVRDAVCERVFVNELDWERDWDCDCDCVCDCVCVSEGGVCAGTQATYDQTNRKRHDIALGEALHPKIL